MVAGGASARKLHLCKICTTAAQQERRSSQGACGAVRRERRAAGGRRIVPLKPRQALAASAASAGGAPGSCATVFDSRRDDAGGQHALDMRRGQAQQQQLALARPWQSVAEIPDFQVGNRGTNRFCARAERARLSCRGAGVAARSRQSVSARQNDGMRERNRVRHGGGAGCVTLARARRPPSQQPGVAARGSASTGVLDSCADHRGFGMAPHFGAKLTQERLARWRAEPRSTTALSYGVGVVFSAVAGILKP